VVTWRVGDTGAVHVSRRFAGFLLLVAIWNVVTYVNFVRNLLHTEGRPLGYYVAHAVLVVVNLGIAVVLGRVGWRAWRRNSAGT
jgi:hypothetical protein